MVALRNFDLLLLVSFSTHVFVDLLVPVRDFLIMDSVCFDLAQVKRSSRSSSSPRLSCTRSRRLKPSRSLQLVLLVFVYVCLHLCLCHVLFLVLFSMF